MTTKVGRYNDLGWGGIMTTEVGRYSDYGGGEVQ